MLALKLIPVLWIAVLLANIFCKRYTPEIASWYPAYSIVVGLIATLFFLIF